MLTKYNENKFEMMPTKGDHHAKTALNSARKKQSNETKTR